MVPADLWRGLARWAGAHVWCESNDVILAFHPFTGSNQVVWLATTNSGVTNLMAVHRCTDLAEGRWTPVVSNLARSVTGTNVWDDLAPPSGPAYYRPSIQAEGK